MRDFVTSNSPVVRFINHAADLVILNICYLLCCLPVITIGAASAALYGTCFRFGTEQEGNPVSVFFRLFRSSLKMGTVLWLLMIVCSAGLLIAAWLLYWRTDGLRLMCIPVVMLLVAVLMTAWYVFALVGLFDNSLRATISNGMILCAGYLHQSLLIFGLNWMPVVLAALAPGVFMWATGLWLFLYFSLAAKINSKLARKAFASLLPWGTTEPSITEE